MHRRAQTHVDMWKKAVHERVKEADIQAHTRRDSHTQVSPEKTVTSIHNFYNILMKMNTNSQVEFGLTCVCAIPGIVQNNMNNRSTWTLCPWRLLTGPRSRSTMGATHRLSWTTLKRAGRCRWAGVNQLAARDANTGGFEVDPGDARWANINLEGTCTTKLNYLWHNISHQKCGYVN